MQTDNTNDIPAEATDQIANVQQSEVQPAPQPAVNTEPQKNDAHAIINKTGRKKKRKRHPLISLLRIVIALIIIAVGIYLILFIVAYAAKYDSISAMLESMRVELDLMWQRIKN